MGSRGEIGRSERKGRQCGGWGREGEVQDLAERLEKGRECARGERILNECRGVIKRLMIFVTLAFDCVLISLPLASRYPIAK